MEKHSLDTYLKGEIAAGKGVGKFYFGIALEEVKKILILSIRLKIQNMV